MTIIYQEPHVTDLIASVSSQRGAKKPRIKKYGGQFQKAFYVFNTRMLQEHNCKPYLITITFPKTKESLPKEWASMAHFLQSFKQGISEQFLCVGGFFALEPHRNTSLKSKKGANTKAGRPHIHAIVWLMHEFLNPNPQYIDFTLSEININAKVQPLNKDQDLVSAAVYSIKEMQNPLLKYVCKVTLNWNNNCALWINQQELKPLFLYLQKTVFKKSTIFEDFLINVPSTPQWQDDQLFFAQFFAKLFAQNQLSLKDGFIYKPVTGTRFTWAPYMSLSSWISNQFGLNMPTAYLMKLKEVTSWIYNSGSKKKGDPLLNIFPSLIPSFFLIEFKDCLFNLENATIIPLDKADPSTVCTCYEPYPFHESPLPLRFLYLFYVLFSMSGDDIERAQQEREFLKQHDMLGKCWIRLPFDKIRYAAMSLDLFDNNMQKFKTAFKALGGLFHPFDNRKQNPALYLTGPSNTFKTFFVQTLLTKLVGPQNIDIISRHSSRFNTARLKKENDLPYVLVLDDFRWDNYGMSTGEFLNFLDGKFVHTEQKYGKAVSGPLKGTIAITSNHSLGHGPLGPLDSISTEDVQALGNRLFTINFHSLTNPRFDQIPSSFWQDLETEAVSFSILANAFFLNNTKLNQPVLPQSFSTEKPFNPSKYEENGLVIFQLLMDHIHSSGQQPK